MRGDFGDAVTQLGALGAEGVVLDFTKQPEIEQLVLLFAKLSELTLKVIGLAAGCDLLCLRQLTQSSAKPVTHGLWLANATKDTDHLLIHLGLV